MTIYDPANQVDGEARDLCIEDGRIVASLPDGAPSLDVKGMVVMPGGVDIHSHLASSSCNHARRLLPEEHAADPAPRPALTSEGSLARAPEVPSPAPSPPATDTQDWDTPPSSTPL